MQVLLRAAITLGFICGPWLGVAIADEKSSGGTRIERRHEMKDEVRNGERRTEERFREERREGGDVRVREERRIKEGEDALRERGKRETRSGDSLGAASPHTLGGPIRVEDCANGGWRRFPTRDFKSQADCASAVTAR
jgi:hypothetical protein